MDKNPIRRDATAAMQPPLVPGEISGKREHVKGPTVEKMNFER